MLFKGGGLKCNFIVREGSFTPLTALEKKIVYKPEIFYSPEIWNSMCLTRK